MGDVLLRADNLASIRGGRLLFEAVEVAIAAGEALVVNGANGSGKSTLLRILAGLLTPTSGRVERQVRTAYLGHENALKAGRTLLHELAWWARLDGGEAVLALGLEKLGDVPVRMLSAGQKRRAALARVIGAKARLWLLDEPGAGLDVASSAALSAAIAAHLTTGGGVVVASHGETLVSGGRVLRL